MDFPLTQTVTVVMKGLGGMVVQILHFVWSFRHFLKGDGEIWHEISSCPEAGNVLSMCLYLLLSKCLVFCDCLSVIMFMQGT